MIEIDKLVNSYPHYVKYVWEQINLPPPTRMQLEIAMFLQENNKRMIIQALRGIGKTYLTGAYVTWRLLRNPDEKVLIVSQSGAHAQNIATFIRNLISSCPILQHLQPRPDQRDSVISFDVNGCNVSVQPSVKALGITSQLQGNRASLLISDDVEGQQNSATEIQRAKLLNSVAEYEAILMTKDEAQIIYLGTPQSAESIYSRLNDKGYKTRIFPARYPENLDNYKGQLAPYIYQALLKDPDLVGRPIDKRFTEVELLQREASYGQSGFRLQFMLDTTLSDADRYPLKLKDFIVTSLDKTQAPTHISWSGMQGNVLHELANLGFTGDRFHSPLVVSDKFTDYDVKYMAIDPAGRGSDETSYAIVGTANSMAYVLDVGGFSGGYSEETLTNLALKAKEYKVNCVYVEENFGDGMYGTLLRPVINAIYPCSLEGFKVSGQKEVRILNIIEPLLSQHRLVIDYGLLAADIKTALESNKIEYSLCYQLTHLTRDRNSLIHDDRVDVLAMVLSQVKDMVSLAVDEAISLHKQQELDKELDRINDFFSRTMGRHTKHRDNYINYLGF